MALNNNEVDCSLKIQLAFDNERTAQARRSADRTTYNCSQERTRYFESIRLKKMQSKNINLNNDGERKTR